jgi:hypothetical protein
MSEPSPARNQRDQGSNPSPAPLNRAARRGAARGQDLTPVPSRTVGRRARPAQGRRINPIRRTG